ncbi:MAG: spore germination protein, partial [Candidatus Pacebacteria bacterium]|nr:spore germination protein [Candidatus Paceibacterota bacterium]
LRFFLLLLAGAMGNFGITMGLLTIMVHLVSLRSFGMPFMSPIAPLRIRDLKDSFVRAPIWLMLTRPKNMSEDIERQELKIPPTKARNKKNHEK